jgi:hypothetical protein
MLRRFSDQIENVGQNSILRGMRRWLWPAAVYAAITVALTYPLIARLRSALPHDAGDPVLNMWILWWSSRRLPLTAGWWNAPMFYPMAGAFALSEVLIGLLPISLPVQWITHSPVAAYNAAFLVSFLLCALAAYALAVELTGRRDAAFLAGVAFAFAPYRMSQLAHVQMLSYYWTPVALLGLHRYLRTRERRWLALFAVGWLLQALSNGYALFHLSVLVALWIMWFARPLRAAGSIVTAWACAVLAVVPVLLTYRQIHAALHLARGINDISRFGADLADFLSTSPDLAFWGSRLRIPPVERELFPGVTILVIGMIALGLALRRHRWHGLQLTAPQKALIYLAAGAGAAAISVMAVGPWRLGPLTVTDFYKPFSITVGAMLLALSMSHAMRRAWHAHSVVTFYAVATIAMYLLALGPAPRAFGRPLLYKPPYAWLMQVPGFDALRVPARFAMLAVLCQALLLAFWVARWSRASTRRVAVMAISAGLLVDGWIRLPIAALPSEGPRNWESVAAVVELPPGEGPVDFGAIYRQMSYGRPIVNGNSGYEPPHYAPLVHAIRDRQYAALHAFAEAGPLGVVVNRSTPDAASIEAAIRALDGVQRGPLLAGWATFTLLPQARHVIPLGPNILPRMVGATPHKEDTARMLDRNIDTAWGSGASQIGTEEVVADLGSEQLVGAIVLRMGSYAFGFPRYLEIEVSPNASAWTSAWSGQTAVQTVSAAVADPSTVPLTIELGGRPARFIRLRQTGIDPDVPWWIAELEIHRPN